MNGQAISTKGNFSFWLNDDGDWTPIIDWTHSDFIVPDGDHRLEVGAEDGQFVLFINGHLVAQMDEKTRPVGGVGLMMSVYEAGDAVIYEFDDFELRAP
jgi:hypothetical protein